MRTITAHRFVDRRDDPRQVWVVVEGFVALVALIAFIGGICGLLTWALVRLITAYVG
jgi:hypothetical protein